MKHRFLSFALMTCAFAAAAFHSFAVEPIIAAYRMARGFVSDAFKAVGESSTSADLNPVSLRLKFKAFTQRIEKRERPVVTSSWRMCPSI